MFDFFGIDTISFEKFEISLNNNINNSIRDIQIHYKQELKDFPFDIDKDDSIISFKHLISSVSASKQNIYILIDEYDASINEALGNMDLVKGLQTKQTEESKEKITKIESKFKQIFSNFKEASEKKGAYVFVTGVTPLALTEFTSGFNNAYDISLDKNFNEMYGFTEEEVESLLNFTPETLRKGILNYLKEKYIYIYF